jgi:putative SOS response-associated peptidase YedK
MAPFDPRLNVFSEQCGSRQARCMRSDRVADRPTGRPRPLTQTNSLERAYARLETVDTTPSFRQVLKKRSCLTPVDEFHEWKQVPGGNIPSSIEVADNALFVFAGLWEGWSLNRGYIFPRHSQITMGIAIRIHPRNITRKGQSPTRTS